MSRGFYDFGRSYSGTGDWGDTLFYSTGGGTHVDPFAGHSSRAQESRERLRLATILAKLKVAVDCPVLDSLQPVKLGRAVRAMAGADPDRFERMKHREAVEWLRRTAQELQ
jgi:hypothetical protein